MKNGHLIYGIILNKYLLRFRLLLKKIIFSFNHKMEQTAGAKKTTKATSKKATPKKETSKKATPKKATSKKATTKKATGKRQLNGFMKFLSEKRDEIKKAMPTAKVHEISKKAGEMWRKLTDIEKSKFK